MSAEHAPSGVRVGDKRSDSILFSGHIFMALKISAFDRPHDSKFFADSKLSTLERRLKNITDLHDGFAGFVRTEGVSTKKNKQIKKFSGYVWTGPKECQTNTVYCHALL